LQETQRCRAHGEQSIASQALQASVAGTQLAHELKM